MLCTARTGCELARLRPNRGILTRPRPRRQLMSRNATDKLMCPRRTRATRKSGFERARRENCSASQIKHDVPGEVLIGDVSAPVVASESTSAVRVAEVECSGTQEYRDECCVEIEWKRRGESKDSVAPFQHAFAPCLDLHLLSFCNFQPMTIPLPKMSVPYR